MASYQQALGRQPGGPEARANLALVQKLIPPKKKEDEQEAANPNQKPDELEFDDKAKKGKVGEVELARKQTAEMWMRNIETTPRELLRQKSALEAALFAASTPSGSWDGRALASALAGTRAGWLGRRRQSARVHSALPALNPGSGRPGSRATA